ncbi:MAG: transketolase [Halobacteriovoraceae bacterium]|mgnify:CR=1 FL=1|nr:transketolase [Halobacteriovoraceae bacterium]|tara:strand:+ start:414 stop:2387 length:1974 start_codon:yes stop_codon:yes gene_type:complete
MKIAPLKIKNKLHSAKGCVPKYKISIKDQTGNEVVAADPKATRAMLALMDLGAVNGGAACHWGGPAAAAEMASAIHAKMFQNETWTESYNFVNDIGHAENGIYALRANLGFGGLTMNDLKGFRSIESKLTGHGESHLYPEGVLLSNGPLGSALPQAQGLAMADKLIENDRVTVCMVSDGASMEGEAKESFAAIPGLSKKGKLNPFILVISDNNTKLSGRIEADSYDMGPSFEAMSSLGWNTIKVENGNNLEECYHAFESALEQSQSGPVFIWLKTVKGFGVKSTEESASGGHGFPIKARSKDIYPFLEEILGGDIPSEFKSWADELTAPVEAKKSSGEEVKKEKVQAGLARGAVKAAKDGSPVISVSCDLQGSTGMGAFHKEFPERSFDIGIAESNMVSCAAGMSKLGYIPIVDTFAAFGVTKGNLPLIMSSLSEAPMIAVFSHAGFQDAADGASHQSLTYISAVSSIPNTKVVVPASSEEAEALMIQAIDEIETSRLEGRSGNSYIFFVGREGFPTSLSSEAVKLGSSQVLVEGKDALIAACGPMVSKAIQASEILKEAGHSVGVINCHNVNDVDVDTVKEALGKASSKLITIEDHQVVGGMGAQLVHALSQAGIEFKSKSLGVKGEFGQSAYTADELYKKNGLDAESLVAAFNQL